MSDNPRISIESEIAGRMPYAERMWVVGVLDEYHWNPDNFQPDRRTIGNVCPPYDHPSQREIGYDPHGSPATMAAPHAFCCIVLQAVCNHLKAQRLPHQVLDRLRTWPWAAWRQELLARLDTEGALSWEIDERRRDAEHWRRLYHG